MSFSRKIVQLEQSFLETYRNRSDIVLTETRLVCEQCGVTSQFFAPTYINEKIWPEVISLLGKDNDELIQNCSSCSFGNYVPIPLLYDSPRRDLIIFVAHTGKESELLQTFEFWRNHVCEHLDDSVVQGIKSRPYTIVRGWDGLKSLRNRFNQETLQSIQYPIGTPEYPPIYGYLYSDMVFYYPRQRLVQCAVSGILVIAEGYQEHGELERAWQVLTMGIEFCPSNQWLAHAYGATSLLLGRLELAKKWLEEAQNLKHDWITPLLSFVDPTAVIERADGPTQDRTLPHAPTSSTLGVVTAAKHCVTPFYPRHRDDDHWSFLGLEQQVQDCRQDVRRLLAIFGATLGEIARYGELYGSPSVNMSAAEFFIQEHLDALARELEEQGRSIPGDWVMFEYVIRRWNLDRSTICDASHASASSRIATARALGSASGYVQRLVMESRSKKETPPRFLELSYKELSILFYRIANCVSPDEKKLIWEEYTTGGMTALNPGLKIEGVTVNFNTEESEYSAEMSASYHEDPRAVASLKHKEMLREWETLPWWKRLVVRRPVPPKVS